MLKEIVTFVDSYRDDLEKLAIKRQKSKNSLNVIFDSDLKLIDQFYYFKTTTKELNRELIDRYDLRARDFFMNMLNAHKSFDGSAKKVHSISPYGFFFKEDTSIENVRDSIKNRYFENIKKYQKDEEIEKIEKFANDSMLDFLFILDKTSDEYKQIDYIRIYILADMEKVKSFQKLVFAKQLFNSEEKYEKGSSYSTKNEYICPITNESHQLGLSGFFNSLNQLKPFLHHKNRNGKFPSYNLLVSHKVLDFLNLFENLLKNGVLPNPLPIFISKENLENQRMVELLDKNENRLSFVEIIKTIISKSSDSLNYYLIYWQNSKSGLEIYDIDYVENFQYKLDPSINITNILDDNERLNFNENYQNIFDLERAFKVFLNIEDGSLPYFSDKFNSPYEREFIDSIFDFIYKAKSEAISNREFQKLALESIKDSIEQNRDISKDIDILKKVNLYLHLNSYFKGEKLSSLNIKHMESLKEILNIQEKNNYDGEKKIEDDKLFAFALGQLIRYLVNQNQSASKTHSLISVYISKHNIDELIRVLAENMNKYSHSLEFNKRFDKLSSEVFGYSFNGGFKKLIPIILAGYFTTNIIYTKSNKEIEDEK